MSKQHSASANQSNAPGDSIILEEEIDPNYEPTEDEIKEYATWLGMVRALPCRALRMVVCVWIATSY